MAQELPAARMRLHRREESKPEAVKQADKPSRDELAEVLAKLDGEKDAAAKYKLARKARALRRERAPNSPATKRAGA